MSRVAEQPWTLGRLLTWTTNHFAKQGFEAPRLEAEVLLAHAQGCKRIELYTRFDEVAEESVRNRFRELVRQRLEGCPVAYLVGVKEFFSLEFEVSPAVLIPRPDTETLVLATLEAAAPGCSLLEIGTGSGAVAIALAKHLPSAEVTATDRSAEALEVARRNAVRHGVASRVRFLQGDLFEPLDANARFDLIISNPPYIPTAEIETLAQTVRAFEPRIALDGGPDGLAVIQRLIAEAPPLLNPGGWLLLETSPNQQMEAAKRMEAAGLEVQAPMADSAGRPRVARGRKR
ncbi:MAG: peptide chain release factor N(5)-glutamine methyltransferase [Gemmatales bacterium]|nr:peptide chain release factor N(5)-glutamine methyltransferase [Gemmatales bacterium]MDW8385683.1 peptide chain release factor N(5)-glutamine methyltransferase [Gemmatales bacterium]